MSSSVNEPSFRESVEIMYNRAVQLMDLPDGLKEKIRVCNATYTVRSGLDDTMRITYQQMSDRWHSHNDVKDLRTAAFLLAIDKIAAGYRAKGI